MIKAVIKMNFGNFLEKTVSKIRRIIETKNALSNRIFLTKDRKSGINSRNLFELWTNTVLKTVPYISTADIQ